MNLDEAIKYFHTLCIKVTCSPALTSLTKGVSISSERRSALAELLVVPGLAVSTLSTRAITLAQEDALLSSVVALLSLVAVIVLLTSYRDAPVQRVALHARRAVASGTVILGLANGTGGTLIVSAGIYAFPGVASFVQWAVFVSQTFDCREYGNVIKESLIAST